MKKKFNFIDVIIIMLVVAVAAGGFWYVTRDKGEEVFQSNRVKITYIAEADRVGDFALQQLAVGDQMVSNDVFQDAYVESIEVVDTTMVAAVEGKLEVFDVESYNRIRVKISGTVNKYGPYMDLGGQEIKAGVAHHIKTDLFEAVGNVVYVEAVE